MVAQRRKRKSNPPSIPPPQKKNSGLPFQVLDEEKDYSLQSGTEFLSGCPKEIKIEPPLFPTLF